MSWLCYEDIPALQQITIIMKGKSYLPPFSYLILDEAQDYMPYEIYVMSKMTSSNGLMLIGDLVQNLNEASGVVNWNEFSTLLDTPSYFELQATYRSTTQIVEVSNEIIRPFSSGKYTLSEQTYREGADVKWIPTNKVNLYKHIAQLLKDIESRTENYESIAIIVKTREEGIELQQNLSLDYKIEFQSEDQAVKSKIIVTTPIASKGLSLIVLL